MTMSDPIGDMLTRIRNQHRNRAESVDIPYSVVKHGVAEVMQREGYIARAEIIGEGVKRMLRVFLKYDEDGRQVIRKIERYSKPGKRLYRGHKALPKVLDGLGISIVSTPQGILSDREARIKGVGGEVLCTMF